MQTHQLNGISASQNHIYPYVGIIQIRLRVWTFSPLSAGLTSSPFILFSWLKTVAHFHLICKEDGCRTPA